MNLSERLKYLRKSLGLSQRQLSELTGISVHSINSYESGRREPKSKTMKVFENYFHVSEQYLRGEIDNPHFQSSAIANAKPVVTKELLQGVVNKVRADDKERRQTFLMHGGGGEKVSPEDEALFLAADAVIVREILQDRICNRVKKLDTPDLERVEQMMNLLEVPDGK